MRLPCPVGHNGLLSISGVSAGPPSLLTPPLCTDVHPATSLPHCYRDRTPRALRDLRAPSGGQVCLLGFLRHPPTRPCRKQALYIAGQTEPPVLPLLCLTGSMLLLLL